MSALKQRRPTFLWQGLLILLPVAVLAAVGSWALRQDRASVEREAKSRADAVASATLIQLENQFQVLKFSEEDGVLTIGIPPGVIWFTLRSNNVLSQSFPLYWPPQPVPLNPTLDTLKSNKLEQWQAAQVAFANRDWQAAVDLYTTFLDGRIRFEQITKSDVQAGLNDARIRSHALFFRASALEHAGKTNEAIEAYDGVIVGHLVSGDPRTESGISINHLAILKVLDLAQDQFSRLPPRWQTNVIAVVNWLSHESSPYGEQILRRLRSMETELTTAGRLGRVQLSGILHNAEQQHEYWRVYNEAAATLGPEAPWPDEFWVDGRYRWLAVAQIPPSNIPSPFSDRHYVAFPENLLFNALDSTARQADPAGDFAVRIELHRRTLSAREGTATDWQRKEISTTARSSTRHLLVTATLADPAAFFAAQQKRQRLLSLLLLVSAATCVMAFSWARRAFRRQLRLNEMKSNFVSSVSHELRAPIASVRLMAESLERGKISEPAKQGEYFRFIVQECRRLSSLIENVLDFSRIEQGRKQYEFEPTDIVALVQQTVKLMEPYAVERGVKLETSNIEHRTSNIELNVDGRAIQQALVNLMDNAIKHSPKGEKVKVEVRGARGQVSGGPESGVQSPESDAAPAPNLTPDPSHLTLSVTDHGPGIPASEQEKIFERFYRLGSELRRETQGVGIGLSIVKHIVEAHAGRVRVESEPGQGSRFTIELPRK